MAGILRFSEGMVLAIHTLIVLALNPQEKFRVVNLAKTFSCSEHHLSKIMQRLAKAGYVEGQRGPYGGYKLIKDPSGITIMDIFNLIEGSFDDLNCLLGKQICNGTCFLGPLVNKINVDIKDYFTNTSIRNIVDKMKDTKN